MGENPARTLARYRKRLDEVAAAARACVLAYGRDEDTTEAYADLRRVAERIGRMRTRERGAERRLAGAIRRVGERRKGQRALRGITGQKKPAERGAGKGG